MRAHMPRRRSPSLDCTGGVAVGCNHLTYQDACIKVARHQARPAQMSSSAIRIEIEMPGDLAKFKLPAGVQERLNTLLDKQDEGQPLTDSERREAEGLVDLADLLSLLRLRAKRVSAHP